jgi:hypothetical protein
LGGIFVEGLQTRVMKIVSILENILYCHFRIFYFFLNLNFVSMAINFNFAHIEENGARPK